MIALLRGVVAARSNDSVVVDVQGVGYEVFVPAPMVGTLTPGTEVRMHIHTSVREDSITLFGFTEVQKTLNSSRSELIEQTSPSTKSIF